VFVKTGQQRARASIPKATDLSKSRRPATRSRDQGTGTRRSQGYWGGESDKQSTAAIASEYSTAFSKSRDRNGDYKDEVKEQPGSESVVPVCDGRRVGIGYSASGYDHARLRAITALQGAGWACMGRTRRKPTPASIDREISYIYVKKPEGKTLDTLTREFEMAAVQGRFRKKSSRDGYFPLRCRSRGGREEGD